ncbi:GntR family transcriptional regulator [Spirosoma soli]|uniref:GntR family transcriptional regulator n=1 Tax=Spirosoma soli TaxID=1770529 RepID=A0ABW5MAB3_9BACT
MLVMNPTLLLDADENAVSLSQIRINSRSEIPKYWQIYNSIIEGIEQQSILPGYKLPSIHEVSGEFDISHGTVEKAYRLLKANNIINSVNGKGFYVCHTPIGHKLKVFLLFNKLSTHKKIIYDALVDSLGPDVFIDFHIYNNDFQRFSDLIQREDGGHTHYVIIPHFFDQEDKARAIINALPKDKLLILDKFVEGISGKYAAVYQNFQADIEYALTEALPLLRKYHTLNILFPAYTYHPKAILNGFYSFCHAHNFKTRVVYDIDNEAIRPGNAYINLMEDDLVTLVKKIKQTSLRLGQDVGILSYNETPVKEIILDGITVMSTDFAEMGRMAAQLIRENRPAHIENPFRLIVRHSL